MHFSIQDYAQQIITQNVRIKTDTKRIISKMLNKCILPQIIILLYISV